MAEYTVAVVSGRPTFHISLITDVSPNCDCHGENDAPILPDIGMLASFDPVALDQACVDLCQKAKLLETASLAITWPRAASTTWEMYGTIVILMYHGLRHCSMQMILELAQGIMNLW